MTTPETPEIEGQLTVQDILDSGEAPQFHTILEVWNELLNGSEKARAEPITVQWAVKICGSYNGVDYADMPLYKDTYFNWLDQLREILRIEISDDDEAFNQTTADEDRSHNAEHYLNVLVDWQKQFLQWELEWDPTSPTAGVQVATMSELHTMFFGPTGLTNLLDQINFEITDEDRDYLAGELEALIAGASAGGSSE